MLGFFDEDTNTFLMSKEKDGELVEQWRRISREIQKRNWHESLWARLRYHKTLRDNKIVVVREYLDLLWSTFITRQTVLLDESKRFGVDIFDSETSSLSSQQKQIYQELTAEFIKNTYAFVGMLQGLIDVSFFAFESSCKILSSLGCYDFAANVANNQIIQHEEIWRTLKSLAKEENSKRCTKCLLTENWKFQISFKSVANAYCYAILTRMLSDYADLFYTFLTEDDLKHINRYFENIRRIVEGQQSIEQHCLGW
jgi:hypothetical protein